MGTCYYLRRDDGKLFDLDKAYGLARYLRAGRWEADQDPASPSFDGWPCTLGEDLDALVLVLAECQEFPDGDGRIAWARRMLEFSGGRPVVLYDEHRVPYGDSEWISDLVIGERFQSTPDDLDDRRP
jgi:hypothetical protein